LYCTYGLGCNRRTRNLEWWWWWWWWTNIAQCCLTGRNKPAGANLGLYQTRLYTSSTTRFSMNTPSLQRSWALGNLPVNAVPTNHRWTHASTNRLEVCEVLSTTRRVSTRIDLYRNNHPSTSGILQWLFQGVFQVYQWSKRFYYICIGFGLIVIFLSWFRYQQVSSAPANFPLSTPYSISTWDTSSFHFYLQCL